jgi:hypothetical protein
MTILTAVFLLVVLAIFVGGGTQHSQFRHHLPKRTPHAESPVVWASPENWGKDFGRPMFWSGRSKMLGEEDSV